MANWTTTQLEQLERAIASGTRSVEYVDNGRTNRVEYRSLSEMMALRDRMRADLGITNSKGRRKVASYRTGLG